MKNIKVPKSHFLAKLNYSPKVGFDNLSKMGSQNLAS